MISYSMLISNCTKKVLTEFIEQGRHSIKACSMVCLDDWLSWVHNQPHLAGRYKSQMELSNAEFNALIDELACNFFTGIITGGSKGLEDQMHQMYTATLNRLRR